MAVPTLPTGVEPAGQLAVRGVRTPRFVRLAARTPGRFRMISVALVVLGIVVGTTSLLDVRRRADLLTQMSGRDGVPGASALDIYPTLVDADASAASGFLASGTARAAWRTRYENDIAWAAAAITVASRNAGNDRASVATLARLNTALPVYTGKVETARTLDRQGLPLGFVYLREASELMRGTLLVAAQEVYVAENARVAAAQAPAIQFPWQVVVLGGLTVGALLLAQLYVARRTHRYLNVGLTLATVATLAMVAWVVQATSSAAQQVKAAREDGTQQIELLSQARIDASRARADEVLSLLARGNGKVFDDDFAETTADLIEPNGVLVRAHDTARDQSHRSVITLAQGQARTWLSVHQQVRDLDRGGQYPEAVTLAMDTGPTGGATVFGQLEETLSQALADRRDRFQKHSARAVHALIVIDFGVAALTIMLFLGIVVGLQQRIAEYR